MFSDAVDRASGFTFPFVGLQRHADGSVESTVATFVVLNFDGWIVTSAHIFDELVAVGELSRGDADGPSASGDEAAEHTQIWAVPGFEASKPRLVTGRANPVADVAIGRIQPFDAASVAEYPVLRDAGASPVRQGESVCRLGFPFHSFVAGFEEGEFRIASGSFPVPRFALDGIVSRFSQRTGPSGTGRFIETSTPGLRGQSGGPLLDSQGRVIGIQSHTAHFDLGFDAHFIAADGADVTERQFLNVGFATHVDELIALLRTDGIRFDLG